MAKFDYIMADDFDRAWLNFELDLPLEPGSNGELNPFYVDRPGNPIVGLERKLLREFRISPKYFFSGHKGCGKSTELLRLGVNPAINKKYWIVHFSIKDEADIQNLDFKDILVAIGGRLYRQYRQEKGTLPKKLLEELETWRGTVQNEIKTIISGRTTESEVGAGLDAFFANVSAKIKIEPAVRHELRQVFERNLADLVIVIGKIAKAIQEREKRYPLVLVDDLDKPDLEICREIFYSHRETMLQVDVPIVYTVSSSLFYSSEFHAIRDSAIFLPNVALHERCNRDQESPVGFKTMRDFVYKRMHSRLITEEALNEAIRVSGGLFREMARIMRSAIDSTCASNQEQISIADIDKAEAEIRGDYRRFLTKDQREVLRAVRSHNQYNEPDKIAPLLQLLAVLEYCFESEPWCDIHPALHKLIDEVPEVTFSQA